MESGFRRILLIVALVLSPIVFVSVHVWAEAQYGLPPQTWIICIIAGVVAGFFGIWLMPSGRLPRLSALIVYVPTAILATYLWGFLLACGTYERRL